MARSVDQARVSDPARTLDSIRPTPAKAGLRSDALGQPPDRVGLAIGSVVAEAVVQHYGSVKAAAISLGKDPSQLMRELKAGNVASLDRDPEAKAFVAERLRDAFAEHDPQVRKARLIRDIRRSLDALVEAL
jgi:hypothetical protein